MIITGGFTIAGGGMSAVAVDPEPIPNTGPTFIWTFGSLTNLDWGTNNNISANVTWGRKRYYEVEWDRSNVGQHIFTSNNQIALPTVWYAAPNSSANLYLRGTSGYSSSGGKKLNDDETNVLLNAMVQGTSIDFYSYNFINPVSLILTSNVVTVYPYGKYDSRGWLNIANVDIPFKDGISDKISEVPDNRSFILANALISNTGSEGFVFSPTYEWFMYGTANIKLKTDALTIFKKYANVISGDSNLSVDTTAIWNSNTYFYAPKGNTSLGSLAGDYGYPYIPWRYYQSRQAVMIWQLFYAHKHIKISPATDSWGTINYDDDFYTSGTDRSNTSLYGIVSPLVNNKNNWGSNVILRLNKFNILRYTHGYNDKLQTANTDVIFDVPANRYFLLGISEGYGTSTRFRIAPNNYTAVNVTGDPVVTAVNEAYAYDSTVYYAGVPNQLGGNVSGYRKLSSNIHYSAFRFEEL
jgi:hypothetical protein